MLMSIHREWIDRVISYEGGYTNDSRDSGNWTGGAVGQGVVKGTNYGISAAAYPLLDIQGLTLDEARHIYMTDYLRPVLRYGFKNAPTFQMFDFTVNSGRKRAAQRLQRELGVSQDGAVGPITKKAAGIYSADGLAMLIIAARTSHYLNLNSWKHYGRGWMDRMVDNMKYVALDSIK